MGMSHRWPLPADHTAGRHARILVGQLLTGLPMADDAVLIASELAENAIRHGDPPTELHVDVTDGTVRICVVNTGQRGEPRVVDATHEDDRGRGLALVQALADDWGWHRDGDTTHVWAELR